MPHDSEQHAQHDPLLVVSLAAGDLTGADRDLATGRTAACAECATLHDDLLAIARATAALPTAVRPRDFQLSPEQAARLRPLGWRRFVAAFAAPRLTRQLGVGLTTLGIAGLLVSVLPTVNLGMSGAAGASMAPPNVQSATDGSFLSGAESLASAAASAPAAAASLPAPAGAPSSSYDTSLTPLNSDLPDRSAASDGQGTVGVAGQGSEGTKASPAGDAAERQLQDLTAEEPSGMPLILVASTILLAAGIALLVARRIARGLTGN